MPRPRPRPGHTPRSPRSRGWNRRLARPGPARPRHHRAASRTLSARGSATRRRSAGSRDAATRARRSDWATREEEAAPPRGGSRRGAGPWVRPRAARRELSGRGARGRTRRGAQSRSSTLGADPRLPPGAATSRLGAFPLGAPQPQSAGTGGPDPPGYPSSAPRRLSSRARSPLEGYFWLRGAAARQRSRRARGSQAPPPRPTPGRQVTRRGTAVRRRGPCQEP